MELAIVGVVAAIFHLFTHAFFKALLFLSSGSVMHAMGNVIDMRRIGGLRRVLPITHATFLCGALALAAVPPFSGFWSKDEIVGTAWSASHLPGGHALYLVLFVLAMFTALLTAFYTFRAYFRTFWGEERIPPEAASHGHGSPHESPPVMTIPLMILAVGAVFVGILIGPTEWIGHFLARTPAYQAYLPPPDLEPLNWTLMAASGAIALAGIGLAYLIYVRNPGAEERFAASYPGLYDLSQNRFYMDELYSGIVALPAAALAKLSAFFDVLVDGIVDVIGLLPGVVGRWLRPLQNGLVQFYALAMVLGLTVFLCILTMRGGR
jgi:NADH-quinone oxidoreductase subunit L